MTEAVDTTPRSTSFMPRSQKTNQEKLDALEKEIQELETGSKEPEKEQEPVQKDEPDEGLSKEEANWKKRYSDLRKHQAQKEKEWKEKFEQLEATLSQKSTQEMPQTKEEVEKWIKKHPDVAKIVKAIAKEEAANEGKEITSRVQELEELKSQIARDKAYQALLAKHPDFEKISQSDDFIDWVDSAPKWVQSAIYDDLDVDSAASAIDLYKVKRGIKTVSPDKEAAASIKTRSNTTPVDDESKNYFSESKVAKMTAREYEANEEKILAAMKSGKFIYDMSGAAR